MNTRPVAYFDLDGTVRATSQFIYPRAKQVTLYPGVIERLVELRDRGYLLAGITNQGGVAKGIITIEEVRAAVVRTQELLGPAALDFVTFCPHYFQADGRYCDCKKPAPGLALDALSALHNATLRGGFVVGDDMNADAGLARCLSIPFVDAHRFRECNVGELIKTMEPEKMRCAISEDKVAGVLVGMAVGDALGAAVEFWPRSRVSATFPGGTTEMQASHNWKKGEYTDDTQMALLLADSLLKHSRLDPIHIAQQFLRWSQTAKDVGIQISRVVRMQGYSGQAEESAMLDYNNHPNAAAGNGAVMRCAPIALFHHDSIPMLLADSRRSARLTHGDPKAQSSCVLVNCAIDHFLRGGELTGCLQAGLSYLSSIEKAAWARLEGISSLQESEISSSGYTVATVEAAFWSLLRSTSFEGAVVAAVSLGDDADSVAAVTGAMAGAYYGYNAIPERWKQELLNERKIHRTALDLAGISAAVAEAQGEHHG